jgi:hypothetical protein
MKIVKQSVELVDSMGSDLSVVNAARVSFAKESEWEVYCDENDCAYDKLGDKDVKLINYLASHGHWSPFELRRLSSSRVNSSSIRWVFAGMKYLEDTSMMNQSSTFPRFGINDQMPQSSKVVERNSVPLSI